MLEFIINKETT